MAQFDLIGNVARVEQIGQRRAQDARQERQLGLLERKTTEDIDLAQKQFDANKEQKQTSLALEGVFKQIPLAVSDRHFLELVNRANKLMGQPMFDPKEALSRKEEFVKGIKNVGAVGAIDDKDLDTGEQMLTALSTDFSGDLLLKTGLSQAREDLGIIRERQKTVRATKVKEKAQEQEQRTKTVKRLGPDNQEHLFQFNPETNLFDVDLGATKGKTFPTDPIVATVDGKKIFADRDPKTGALVEIKGALPPDKGWSAPTPATLDGKPVLIQRNLDTNEIKPVEGFGPALKSGQSIEIGPDGSVRIVQGAGAGLAKTTVSAIEKKRLQISRARVALGLVKGQTKREFLTMKGIAREKAGSFADRWLDLQVDKKFRGEFNAWKQKIEQAFQEYRHAITGAQASDREIEHLRRAFPNIDDDAVAFQSKIESLVEFNDAMDVELARISKKGFEFPASEEEGRVHSDKILNNVGGGSSGDLENQLLQEYTGGR